MVPFLVFLFCLTYILGHATASNSSNSQDPMFRDFIYRQPHTFSYVRALNCCSNHIAPSDQVRIVLSEALRINSSTLRLSPPSNRSTFAQISREPIGSSRTWMLALPALPNVITTIEDVTLFVFYRFLMFDEEKNPDAEIDKIITVQNTAQLSVFTQSPKVWTMAEFEHDLMEFLNVSQICLNVRLCSWRAWFDWDHSLYDLSIDLDCAFGILFKMLQSRKHGLSDLKQELDAIAVNVTLDSLSMRTRSYSTLRWMFLLSNAMWMLALALLLWLIIFLKTQRTIKCCCCRRRYSAVATHWPSSTDLTFGESSYEYNKFDKAVL